MTQSLVINLKSILASPVFQNLSPKSWGIIVDGDWLESEGYFSPELKIPDGAPAILLQRSALINEANQPRLLAHELFHLLHFQKRPQEEAWVQEGLALLTEYLVTGNFNRSLIAGFTSPETSLTEGFAFRDRTANTKSQTLAQYGHTLQYFYYIYRLCGKNQLYTKLVNSNSSKIGVNFIDETLKILSSTQVLDPVCTSFEKSFVAFEKARFFPEAAPDSAYIISADLSATIRSAPVAGALAPYSARSFSVPNDKQICHGALVANTCFELQLGKM